jgi:hypothetical protein
MNDVTRRYTMRLLTEMYDGLWDTSRLIENLLGWMSEDEVKEFYKSELCRD